MTSTQEPNTMVPQSALCICSRKWNAKVIAPIYFGTKTKWRSGQTKSKKENARTALDGNFVTYSVNTRFPRVFIPRLQEFPFTVVISKNVFCQGMVALLSVTILLCHSKGLFFDFHLN